MDMITNNRFEILTPTGFKDFDGIRVTEHATSLKITLEGGVQLHCTPDHRVMTENGTKRADAFVQGDKLYTHTSEDYIISITKEPGGLFLDPVNVEGNHLYISEGVVSHNCEFLSSDALLISSLKLQQIAPTMVHHEDMGFKFWVPDEQLGGVNRTYLVSCDPATGSGKDFSAIEVFEFPSLNQVAEYRTNDVNIPLLYAKLKWIILKLSERSHRGRSEVLWTFERNGIGEAIAALYLNDERQPEHAELFCDQQGKLGVYTSGRTKILSCLQLKQLIERTTNGLKVNSEHLLFELKNFVAKGGGYEAKSGATDDAVMATVGIMRLLKRLSEWNDEAFKQVNTYVEPVDPSDQFGDEPVPFVV